MIISDEMYQIFCFGKYTHPRHKPLTEQQNKIFNMKRAKYPTSTIADRLGITEQAVMVAVTEIKAKGWQIR